MGRFSSGQHFFALNVTKSRGFTAGLNEYPDSDSDLQVLSCSEDLQAQVFVSCKSFQVPYLQLLLSPVGFVM